MAAQPAGRRQQTVRLARVKTFLSKATALKQVPAMPRRAGNSLVLTTAVQPREIVLPRVAVEIALAIEACRPVQARGPVAAHSVAAAAVPLVPAVPAAVPVWALAVAVAADAGGN
jgi:hypothetical protein